MGTPVSAEILSKFAPCDTTVPNTRTDTAIITHSPFIPNYTPPPGTRFGFDSPDGSLI